MTPMWSSTTSPCGFTDLVSGGVDKLLLEIGGDSLDDAISITNSQVPAVKSADIKKAPIPFDGSQPVEGIGDAKTNGEMPTLKQIIGVNK